MLKLSKMTFANLFSHLNRRSTRLTPRFSRLQKTVAIFAIFLTLGLLPQVVHAQSGIGTFIGSFLVSLAKGGNLESWLNDSLQFQLTTAIQGIGGNGTLAYIRDYNSPNPIATNYNVDGLAGMAINLTGKTFTPQASGIEYIASTFNNFLGHPAYAAPDGGVGFSNLSGLIPVWKIFRNIVYVFASVIFIVIGFMITLRVKISPQAVVTIQSALPQIVITLILVTFSYAIAGLLIDLSYFVQGAVLALLFGANLITSNNPDITYTQASLSVANLSDVFHLAAQSVPFVGVSFLAGILLLIVGLIITAGSPVGGIIGLLVGILIFTIIILFWIAKLFFGLIKCYATIIFKIILAPLEIGMGAFPSSKMGFNSWIMDLIANIAVFPVVLLFMVLLSVIVSAINSSGTPLWAPSLLANSIIADVTKWAAGSITGNWLGSPTFSSIASLAIGLAGLGILSKLPELVPQAIFNLKPTAWDTAMGKSFSGVTSGAQRVGWGGGQALADREAREYKSTMDDPSLRGTITEQNAQSRHGKYNILRSLSQGRIK